MAAIIDNILILLARVTSHRIWYRWPFPISDAILLGLRGILRRNNLVDTEIAPAQDRKSVV